MKHTTIDEVIAAINAADGLIASLETEELDATPEHVGLILIEADSSCPRFHEALKHDAVGFVIDGALRELGLHDRLKYVDSDDAVSEAWYRLV